MDRLSKKSHGGLSAFIYSFLRNACLTAFALLLLGCIEGNDDGEGQESSTGQSSQWSSSSSQSSSTDKPPKLWHLFIFTYYMVNESMYDLRLDWGRPGSESVTIAPSFNNVVFEAGGAGAKVRHLASQEEIDEAMLADSLSPLSEYYSLSAKIDGAYRFLGYIEELADELVLLDPLYDADVGHRFVITNEIIENVEEYIPHPTRDLSNESTIVLNERHSFRTPRSSDDFRLISDAGILDLVGGRYTEFASMERALSEAEFNTIFPGLRNHELRNEPSVLDEYLIEQFTSLSSDGYQVQMDTSEGWVTLGELNEIPRVSVSLPSAVFTLEDGELPLVLEHRYSISDEELEKLRNSAIGEDLAPVRE